MEYTDNKCWLTDIRYASALKSSTAALVLDSTHIQSRFRRLQARKALGFYQGALSDAEAIIRQADSDDPDLPEVQKEKRSLQLLIKMRPIDLRYVNDEMDSDPEDDWPNEMERVAPVFDPEICFSDSEDMTHEGNGVPCRYYNRPDGCKNGNACKFSHTPDDMSERDLMWVLLTSGWNPDTRLTLSLTGERTSAFFTSSVAVGSLMITVTILMRRAPSRKRAGG